MSINTINRRTILTGAVAAPAVIAASRLGFAAPAQVLKISTNRVMTDATMATRLGKVEASGGLLADVGYKGKLDLLAIVRQISDMIHVAYVRQKEAMGLGHAVPKTSIICLIAGVCDRMMSSARKTANGSLPTTCLHPPKPPMSFC